MPDKEELEKILVQIVAEVRKLDERLRAIEAMLNPQIDRWWQNKDA